jgi:hypothetical protein
MLGDRLDRDSDLFSLAAITLDRSLPGCESGFWRARASQNRTAVRSEAFFTLGTRTNISGSSMRTVTVLLPAAGFSAALAAMREWLDRNRYEPTKFNYDQDDEAVVLSVEFPNDQEGEGLQRVSTAKNPSGRRRSQLEFGDPSCREVRCQRLLWRIVLRLASVLTQPQSL